MGIFVLRDATCKSIPVPLASFSQLLRCDLNSFPHHRATCRMKCQQVLPCGHPCVRTCAVRPCSCGKCKSWEKKTEPAPRKLKKSGMSNSTSKWATFAAGAAAPTGVASSAQPAVGTLEKPPVPPLIDLGPSDESAGASRVEHSARTEQQAQPFAAVLATSAPTTSTSATAVPTRLVVRDASVRVVNRGDGPRQRWTETLSFVSGEADDEKKKADDSKLDENEK